MTESIDILRYLEERFPEPPLYPQDAAARRKVDDWMDEATHNHIGVIKTYMYAIAFGGKKSPEEMHRYLKKQKADADTAQFHQRATSGFSEPEVIAAEVALFAFFDRLESELEKHQWLVGEEYSYADIAWFAQYCLMSRTGVVDFQNYSQIRRWAADIMRRPSFGHGIQKLQPWFAPIACRVLKIKSRIQRGGPPPHVARTARPEEK